MNVYWTQVIGNYYIPNNVGLNRFIYKNISAKNCTLEDFGGNQESIDIFNLWNGYSMVCPDFSNGLDDFVLEGDADSMITQNFILNFDRCNTSTRSDCKSDAEID